MKYTKRCSTSLVFREKQIKTTMRCYLTPTGMATIEKQENKYRQGYGECKIGGNVKLSKCYRKLPGSPSKN